MISFLKKTLCINNNINRLIRMDDETIINVKKNLIFEFFDNFFCYQNILVTSKRYLTRSPSTLSFKSRHRNVRTTRKSREIRLSIIRRNRLHCTAIYPIFLLPQSFEFIIYVKYILL